jgi:uncharacterized protein YjiS (DUF1127 family)
MATIDTQMSTDLSAKPSRQSLYQLVTEALAHVSEILIVLLDWLYRARERRQLLGLSDAALKDFGGNRADAVGEGDKPFWRA